MTLVHHRVACIDLGFVGAALLGQNVTLVPSAPDANGVRTAKFEADGGITTQAYSFTLTHDGAVEKTWAVASTVNPDGSTMAFDAVIVAGDLLTDSTVLRFASPEFDVEDIPEVTPTNTVELCNYRPGHSLGVPPPSTAGATKVTCGFRPGEPGVPGSTTPPGPTVRSMADMRWYVTVDPVPPDPARIQLHYEVDGLLWGTNFPLTNGTTDDTFFDPSLEGRNLDLGLQFSYGADSCTLYWSLLQEPGSSGSGRTW